MSDNKKVSQSQVGFSDWLNYHHLLYFWTAARAGGIARAAETLRLAHPTVSGQIRALEASLGEKLFRKKGRGLELTEAGQVAFRYAEEIFGLGREMREALRGRPTGRPLRLVVGVSDAMPKLIVRSLVAPALRLPEPVRLVFREDQPDRLLGDLSRHALDLILTDAPLPAGSGLRAFHHLLGECGVTFFGTGALARRLRPRFPRSLDGAPLLVPTEGASLRRSVEHWLGARGARPRIVAEFDDSALMKVFGQDGLGVFPAPTVLEADVKRFYAASVIGRAPEIRERFYAISPERKLRNPAVVAICEAARQGLFA